jgi:hypothetical protein
VTEGLGGAAAGLRARARPRVVLGHRYSTGLGKSGTARSRRPAPPRRCTRPRSSRHPPNAGGGVEGATAWRVRSNARAHSFLRSRIVASNAASRAQLPLSGAMLGGKPYLPPPVRASQSGPPSYFETMAYTVCDVGGIPLRVHGEEPAAARPGSALTCPRVQQSSRSCSPSTPSSVSAPGLPGTDATLSPRLPRPRLLWL